MIVREILKQTGSGCGRGVVFAAGSSANIILAETVATSLITSFSELKLMDKNLLCETCLFLSEVVQ